MVELLDQVSDYVMRPREVEEYCLWDFVAKTEKVRCKENRVGHNDGGNGAEDLGSSDDERVDKELMGGEVLRNNRRRMILVKVTRSVGGGDCDFEKVISYLC